VTNEEAAISWLYQTCVKEKKYEEKTDMPYHFINKSYVISDAERLNNFASD
jgi:hypothetical protein